MTAELTAPRAGAPGERAGVPTPVPPTAVGVLGRCSRLLAGYEATRRSDLAAHLDVYGPLPFTAHFDPSMRARLLDAVVASGLAGRGGAAFPTARKWASPRAASAVLAVNAMEGEPASAKDRTLLRLAPHLVLDGALLAASALGASQIVVCIAEGERDAQRAARQACAQRDRANLLWVPTGVEPVPDGYVHGEESALAHWLGGGAPLPTFRPVKGTALRLGRRPVLVHNAETLAQVALLARYGPGWFRSAGTPDAPGTTLVTLSGALRRPGVYEVELGVGLGSMLEDAGVAEPLAAVLVGGYGGSWLAPADANVAYAPGALGARGVSIGPGIVVAMPAAACGVAETARVARYMADQGAGQCGPCVFGLPALARSLGELAAGRAGPDVFAQLRRRLEVLPGRGACRHPDGVVRFVASALGVFAADFERHARGQVCAHSARPALLPTAPRLPERWRRGSALLVGRR